MTGYYFNLQFKLAVDASNADATILQEDSDKIDQYYYIIQMLRKTWIEYLNYSVKIWFILESNVQFYMNCYPQQMFQIILC